MNTPATKTIHTLANTIVDGIARAEISNVATFGFKGELPAGLSEDDRFELLCAVQDIAKCIEAGAVRAA